MINVLFWIILTPHGVTIMQIVATPLNDSQKAHLTPFYKINFINYFNMLLIQRRTDKKQFLFDKSKVVYHINTIK